MKVYYIVFVVVFLVGLYVILTKEKFTLVPLYTEPSLACQLGMKTCTLSNGKAGRCDSMNSRCIVVPDLLLPSRAPYSLQVPAGEPNFRCQYSQVCERNDGESGVCFSGLCYESTLNIRS